MYRIAIFKIRPEPDHELSGRNPNRISGYLLHNSEFFGLLCGTNEMYYSLCLFSALCAHTLHRSTTNMCKTVGLRDSLVLWSLNALTLVLASGELSSTNCQKGQSTIRLRYPVPGTVLAGTGTGFEKMAGYPANRNRISGRSLHFSNAHCTIIMSNSFRLVYWIGLWSHWASVSSDFMGAM